MSDKKPAKIVLIDDSRFVLAFIKKALGGNPAYELFPFTKAAEALEFIGQTDDLSLICTDLNMPEIDGFEVIGKLKEMKVEVPIIVITGSNELTDALRAIRLGAFDYIVKPIDNEQLDVSISRTLKMRELEQANLRYVAEIEKINTKNRKELDMGSQIQLSLMPDKFPVLKNFKFGHKYVPSNSIGGDFFDLLDLPEPNLTGLFFIDISGHGIPAALITVFVKSEISAAIKNSKNLSKDIRQLNGRLANSLPQGKFASTFFLLLDDEKKSATFCKCSQEPCLLFKPDGSVTALETEGILLGSFDDDFLSLDEDFEFEVKTIQLEAGDRLVLYTDGMTEAENAAGEMFSEERMIETIKTNPKLGASELCEELYQQVSSFSDQQDLEDDFTILAIDVL